MGISEIIRDVITANRDAERFSLIVDSKGANFTLPIKQFDSCVTGDGDGWMLHQYVYLKMLEEQGVAEQIRNGFSIPSELFVTLEADAFQLLETPSKFPGSFIAKIPKTAANSKFSVELVPVSEDGQLQPIFDLKGPLIRFSDSESYVLSEPQFKAFTAIQSHRNSSVVGSLEISNYRLINDLKQAKADGMRIDLAHFESFDIQVPDSVGLTAIEREDGGLDLVPSFGGGDDPLAVKQRMGQVSNVDGSATLRVGEKLILLDEKRLKATAEIIENRQVNKAQVNEFLRAPGTFLDASLVNLDVGFSLRVRGVTEFKHAYFGDTDESGIDWFASGNELVFAPQRLTKIIETEDDLERFEAQLADAQKSGAQQVKFDGQLIDISDGDQVNASIKAIRSRLASGGVNETGEDAVDDGDDEDSAPPVTTVPDINLNDTDEDFSLPDDELALEVAQASYRGAINLSDYKRQPFSYQEVGIRWLLGLASRTVNLQETESDKHGALLADDMGLGKTFMALVAVKEYLKMAHAAGEEQRPVLVVAPLGLLENWKDEVEETYVEGTSPFDSIVTLQASGDLSKYKIGKGVETQQHADVDSNAIRYSLRVGGGVNRLDMPRRLVLTNYETLRDYQFSLSIIDWSFVIFDEAQFIKNPNTLATRAAKALKARFKLLVTGTPVENQLGDFWCLMDTARPGILHSYQDFRDVYIKPITGADDEDKSQARLVAGRQLRRAVGSAMLRRVKEDQLEGLPTKTIFAGDRESKAGTEYLSALDCTMQGLQLQRYEMVISVVRDAQSSGEKGNPVLAGLHRLRDVSLHPGLLDGGLLPMPSGKSAALKTIGESDKLSKTFALLDQIRDRGEKAIIFLINKRLQSFLRVACERIYGGSVSIINGDTKAVAKNKNTDTRKSLIKRFEKTEGFAVIIMSPIAAGMGLNVVGANNVIHLERHWNPAKEAQATDRVYRIGQVKDVNVYLPIIHHPELASFDLKINKLLDQKSALKDAVVTPEEVDAKELGSNLFGIEVAETENVRPEDLQRLSWQQFEALAVELLCASVNGEAKLTKEGADSGADGLIMASTGNILVQAKHTESNKTIRVDAAAEVYKAKPRYEDGTGKEFTRLVVMSNAKGYSGSVKQAAKSYGVELLTRRDIEGLMKKYPVSMKAVTARLDKARFAI